MSRYIDAEKALRTIQGECVAKYPVSFIFGLSAAADEIRKMPTADVVEVRHGRWAVKDLNDPLYESKKAPHCSVCGEMSFIRYDYCPDCGAKMDGERRENDG